MLNTEQSAVLHHAFYVRLVEQVFGAEGSRRLRVLFEGARRIFALFPPDAFPTGLVIVVPVLPGYALPPAELRSTRGRASSPEDAIGLLASCSAWPLIELTEDGSYVVHDCEGQDMCQQISSHALVLQHDTSVENLHAGGKEIRIMPIVVGSPSVFANPTFRALDSALLRYAKTAADCGCELLSSAWIGGADGPRLVLTAKPEAKMRDSLYRFLGDVLRPADVTREHSTDSRKPVDIMVRWHTARVEALIEVKWIGRSVTSGGGGYTNYGPARANEGAGQLADYVQRQRANSTAASTKGYLVVFDARRRNLKGPTDRLTRADATHFVNKDIDYDPDRQQTVEGFQPPVRLFMRAREDHFAVAA